MARPEFMQKALIMAITYYLFQSVQSLRIVFCAKWEQAFLKFNNMKAGLC